MNKRCLSFAAAIVLVLGVGYALAGTSPVVNRLPVTTRVPSQHSTGPAEAAAGICSDEGYKSESAEILSPILIPDIDDPGKGIPAPPLAIVDIPDDGSTIQDVIVDLRLSHSWIGDIVGYLAYFSNCVEPAALQAISIDDLRSSIVPNVTLLCRQGSSDCLSDEDGCDADLSCDNTYRFGDEATSALGDPTCPEGDSPLPSGCYTVSKASTDDFSIFKDQPKGGCFVLFLVDAFPEKDFGYLCSMTVYMKNTGKPPTTELCCIDNVCSEVDLGQCDHQGGTVVMDCAECGDHGGGDTELCCIDNVCSEVALGQCDHQGGTVVMDCAECGDHGGGDTELCCIDNVCSEVALGQCDHQGGTVVMDCAECGDHGGGDTELCCIDNVCSEVALGQCDHQGGTVVQDCADCGGHGGDTELCCIDNVCSEVALGQCDHQGGTVVQDCAECGGHGGDTELCCIDNVCSEVALGQCDHQGGTVVQDCADCGGHGGDTELCCIDNVCSEVALGQCDHQGGTVVQDCADCGGHEPVTELCCFTPVGAVGGSQECVEVPVGVCEGRGGKVVDNCEQCNDHGPQTELCCSHGQCSEVAIGTCKGLGGYVVSSCTECGIQPHAPVHLTPGEREVELSLARGNREPVLAPVLPNPFVSTTAVYYALPSAALVRLSVYDAAGRLVDRLVERTESSGVHVAEWDGSGHPSGVYFFRLEAGSDVRVRRAVLSK